MTSFAEGLPVVLMEAMAAGVMSAITLRASPGIPELAWEDEQSGLLVSPGDCEATQSAIRRLVEDSRLRNQLALAARAKVEKEFDIQAECQLMARILNDALAD